MIIGLPQRQRLDWDKVLQEALWRTRGHHVTSPPPSHSVMAVLNRCRDTPSLSRWTTSSLRDLVSALEVLRN